jgi:hypothetical protein
VIDETREPDVWTIGALAFAGLLVLFVVMLSGCSSLGPAKASSNALRTALHEAAPILRARCLTPYENAEAMTVEQARAVLVEYDRSGCSSALRAYDDARTAHMALHATIGAIAVGECVGVSRSVDRCNLDAAMAAATRAAAAVYERTRSLGGER